MAPKILMTSRAGRGGQIAELLEKDGIEVVIVPRPEPPLEFHTPNAEEIEKYWRDADGFIMTGRDLVTREALAAATRMKVGASSIIGTENIDVEAATELGIAIGFGAIPENFLGVAEAVVMLAAAQIKKLPAKWNALRTGGYRVEDAGHMVMNSTIGLIGFGNIGQAVAKRLQGWDANLLAADPYVNPKICEELGVKLVDMDTLLRESDVVSVMVILTDETKHIIGERELALMKPGSYLINTARGSCVNEPALTQALQSGHLGGAAIDVWAEEPTPPDNPIRSMPNVIATGHNVGHSTELYEALTPAAVENVTKGLRGERPTYLRNPAVLPRWHERLTAMGVVPMQAIEADRR